MRGRARKQASMLAFVDPETLIPSRPSASNDQAVGRCGAAGVVAVVRRNVRRRSTIDVNRARATGALVAAFFRPGQMETFAQDVKQALTWVKVERVAAAVDGQSHVHERRRARPVLGGPPARYWSPSQRKDQVADRGWLGEEGVVAGVEFHDVARSRRTYAATRQGWGAPVISAHEVRRGHVLSSR